MGEENNMKRVIVAFITGGFASRGSNSETEGRKVRTGASERGLREQNLDAFYEFADPSPLSRCGEEIRATDGLSGSVSTHLPYEKNLQCSWDIQTGCSALEWRFSNFSVEDATDSYDNELYYEEYYGEDHKPKWWICSFDHVQVFFGDKMSGRHTGRLCQWDTDYEEGHPGMSFMTGVNADYIYQDNDPHITNPRSLGYMIWNKIPDSRLLINFDSDQQIISSGFTLEWRCASEKSKDFCNSAEFNSKVLEAIPAAFQNDKQKYTKTGRMIDRHQVNAQKKNAHVEF